MRNSGWAIAAAALLAASCTKPADPVFDGARMGKHVEVLASDAFEGRGVNTPAETKTVDYIIEQFKAAGLEPGGDKGPDGKRGWTQDVTLAKFNVEGAQTFTVKTLKGAKTWSPTADVSVDANATGLAQVSLKDVGVVFAGYGIDAPEKSWNDFAGVDVKGKIILVLVNDPDFEAGAGDFGGKAMTYYGRWTYKYEEAARQGAAGVLVIHETAPAAYGWDVAANRGSRTRFDIVRSDPAKAHAPLEGWIHHDATVSLLAAAGLDYATLKKAAQTRGFKAVELPGVTLSANYKTVRETIVSKNVAGALPGTKRPDETVIYTAHWDHLGIGTPDATGDTIYNGAVDNASGVAFLIEMGRAFAAAPRADRTTVFLAVTAEESGLLGAEYYAANPLYPLGKTVANINTDALFPTGAARDYSLSGDAPQTLQDDLAATARKRERQYSPDPKPEAGYFYRSDHFAFAKAGVPAISFGSGEDLVKGGKAAGKAFADKYTDERYHTPGDEYAPDWNFDGMVQDGALLYALGRDLATSSKWPSWKEGAEFKAERDKTAAERK